MLEELAHAEDAGDEAATQSALTFLSTMSVADARVLDTRRASISVWRQASWWLAGTTGPGKSSCAGVLELARTGKCYRWHNEAAALEATLRRDHTE